MRMDQYRRFELTWHELRKQRQTRFNQCMLKANLDYDVSLRKIFRSLWRHEGISQVELAHEEVISMPTLTRKINTLVKAGLVQRGEDESDSRVNRLYLTPAGKEITQKIDQIGIDNLDILFEDFSDAELEQFVDYLERMHSNLQNTQAD